MASFQVERKIGRVAGMSAREKSAADFIRQTGWKAARRNKVAGDASQRRYERLSKPDGTTAIVMDADPEKGEDVRPFVHIAEYLLSHGLSPPQIFNTDSDNGFLLIEDLGDDLFAQLMAANPTLQLPLYRAATDVLIHLHTKPALDLPNCNADWLTDMTAPVFEWYAPSAGTAAQREFHDIFHPLATTLDDAPKVTILRDYHAENLLWLPERLGVARVGLLDFQDALTGHRAYDLVSVLQDARRDVSAEIEAQMIAHYITSTGVDPTAYRSAYALLGLQRNLRILGIFARLCLRDNKPQYIDLIPRVWAYVMRNLADPSLRGLSDLITPSLPAPTPDFLERLKSQCKTER